MTVPGLVGHASAGKNGERLRVPSFEHLRLSAMIETVQAAIETSGEAQPMQPYYTIMRLPGQQQEEFIQMLPFTPRRRDNLASWMVARSDGDRYGLFIGLFF